MLHLKNEIVGYGVISPDEYEIPTHSKCPPKAPDTVPEMIAATPIEASSSHSKCYYCGRRPVAADVHGIPTCAECATRWIK